MPLTAADPVPIPDNRPYSSIVRGTSMVQHLKFYINGQWVSPVIPRTRPVIHPANEQAIVGLAAK